MSIATDDFFEYVNGDWIKNNPIPADEAGWGSFTILRVQTEEQLKVIMEGLIAAKDIQPGSIKQKVRDFYMTGMDVEKINELGAKPLTPLFALVEDLQNKNDIPNVVARLHKSGAWAFWAPAVEQDEKNSTMMALHLWQAGLGLPDRDYYLNNDEKSKAIRAQYLAYATALFTLSGVEAVTAAHDADVVMAIETRLAKASRTRVDLRDVHKQYNRMSPSELAVLTPSVSWKHYFAALGVPVPEYFIVGQPEFFAAMDNVIEEFPLNEIKIYLTWNVVNGLAQYVSEDFEKLQFNFYSGTFRGTKEMKARWRRVLATVNDLLDDAVGQLYVEHHFSEGAKKKIHALVDQLVVAYGARIKTLDWMDPATKEKALEKLASFSRKLGYPDEWRDISKLTIGADSYAENYMRAYAFEVDRHLQKIGKPVDPKEWFTSPQTVNAFYQPTMNEIVFPAAILQPPFFDPAASDAVNYGGIGTVIGHELTHGFDDQGALFNGKGNLENWWTKEDKERFDEKAKHLAEQFDVYEPYPGLHVNGKLTLGENIADLGGIVIAYDALQLADPSAPVKDFFTNYAVTEQNQRREELERLLIQTDPHSPSRYRVNGPFSNMPEFYEAFGVKEGDKLWRKPEDRVRIW